jgi:sorbitol/mannitol transport system permease protein
MKKKTDYRYLAPAVVVVAVMTQVPFVVTIIYSFIRWNMARPDIKRVFYWFNNYLYFLDPSKSQGLFYSILGQTLLIVLVALVLCCLLGFLIALLLDHDIPGKNVARTLMLGPFFVMSTAAGVIWKTTIFNTTFGWYGVICRALGGVPVDLLSEYPIAVIVLLFVWQWMPFFVLVILGGLQGLDSEVMDSMKMDGVGWLRGIFQIKLPLIWNHMQVAIMLGLVFVIKEFGLILTTTAGGPGTRSMTLPYYVYNQVFNANNVGRAGALATMTVLITLLLVNIIYKSIQHQNKSA